MGKTTDRTAALEEGGKRGDMAFIREHTDEFRGRLADMIKHIAAALSTQPPPPAGVPPSEEGGADRRGLELLMQLKDALEAEDVRTSDAVLNELSSMPLEPRMKNVVSEASDLVLISEFAKAAATLEREMGM